MFKKFASLITLSAFVFSLSAQIAYRIEINSKLNDGDTLILANYFGDKQYAKDTAFAQNGKALFSGQNALSNGVYLVVMPQKNYFEILIPKEDQNFELDVPEDLNPQNIVVRGSKDNTLFLEFGAFAQEQGKKARDIRAAFQKAKSEKEKKELREKNANIANSVSQMRLDLAKANPETFASKVFMSMTDVEIPDAPKDLDDEAQKEWTYNYYKKTLLGQCGS